MPPGRVPPIVLRSPKRQRLGCSAVGWGAPVGTSIPALAVDPLEASVVAARGEVASASTAPPPGRSTGAAGISAVLITPVGEELVFRGALRSVVEERARRPWRPGPAAEHQQSGAIPSEPATADNARRTPGGRTLTRPSENAHLELVQVGVFIVDAGARFELTTFGL